MSIRGAIVKSARLSGRHPFEVFLLAMCVLTGCGQIFGFGEPGSIAAALSPAAATTWSLMLALGGAVALVGVWWKDRAMGLILEQVGVVSVGSGCLVYGAAVLELAGLMAAFPAAISIGLGASCLVRWRQLQKILVDARRHS